MHITSKSTIYANLRTGTPRFGVVPRFALLPGDDLLKVVNFDETDARAAVLAGENRRVGSRGQDGEDS